LVGNQIDLGRNILTALDAGGFPVRSAFWLRRSSAEAPEDWRLVLATPNLSADHAARDVYKQMHDIIVERYGSQLSIAEQQQLLRLLAERVTLVSPSEPLVSILRMAVGTPPNAVSGIVFRNNVINNVLIEDAYIYRSS
jgi:hypothetical protein